MLIGVYPHILQVELRGWWWFLTVFLVDGVTMDAIDNLYRPQLSYPKNFMKIYRDLAEILRYEYPVTFLGWWIPGSTIVNRILTNSKFHRRRKKHYGFMGHWDLHIELCQLHGTVWKLHGAGWDLIRQFGNFTGHDVNCMGHKIQYWKRWLVDLNRLSLCDVPVPRELYPVNFLSLFRVC